MSRKKDNGEGSQSLTPSQFLDKFGRILTIRFRGMAVATMFSLPEYLRITDENLDAQLNDQPSLMGEFGQVLEHARDETTAAAAQVKIEYATLDATKRDELKDDGDKVTEAKVKQMIEADPAYASKKANVAQHEGLVRRLERLMDALRERGRILVEKSRRQREIYNAPGTGASSYPAQRPPYTPKS